jgi:hypothetical protein
MERCLQAATTDFFVDRDQWEEPEENQNDGIRMMKKLF